MLGEELFIEGEGILCTVYKNDKEKNDKCGDGGDNDEDNKDFSPNVLKFQHFPI